MLRNAMNRKADITFQQIAIAVLVLIVLVILIMIFSGNIGNINKEMKSCSAKGGVCVDSQTGCDEGSFHKYGNFSDCKGNNVMCCIKVV